MVSLLGGLIPAPHTVGHRAQLADAGDGARWADEVNIVGCRVEKSSRQYRDPDGRVVTLTAMVITPAVPVVKVGDLLLLDGDERTVEKVDAEIWLDGTVMHHEVWTS